MNDLLRESLLDIDFAGKYSSLLDKHSHRNLMRGADTDIVKRIVRELGFSCNYVSNGKFFKIDDESQVNLHFSIDLGVVEFILSAKIDDNGFGGPYGYLYAQLVGEDGNRKPRFGCYCELTEILDEGLTFYVEIRNSLLRAMKLT